MWTKRESRDLCTLEWQGKHFEYRTANFGEPKNPACYQRMMMTITTLLRSLGYRVTTYIDDCFIVVDPARLQQDNQVPLAPFLLILLKSAFGIYMNLDKSDLSINHEKEFLGMKLNSNTQMVSIPTDKWTKFNLTCRKFRNRDYIQFKDLEKLRGKAISFLLVVCYCHSN